MTATLLEPPAVRAAPTPAQRLRGDSAAVRVSLRWLGVRKTLTPEQKTQAAESFGAETEYLSARKKLLDTRHPAYKEVTAIRGRVLAFWKGITLPFPEPGIRLIRQADLEGFNQQLLGLRGELHQSVTKQRNNHSCSSLPFSNQCMKGRCFLISIARSLVRQIQTVFRRTAGRTPTPYQPTICFQGGMEGLRIRLHTVELFAEFRQDGSFPAVNFIVPLAALADFEGRDSTIVELESSTSGNVTARWSDSGVPKIKEYDAQNLEDLRKFPDDPESLRANDARLVKALHDAMQGTAPQGERYGADKVQLRTSGEIVATDGQQLLLQSGFQFPWTKHVLVPRLGALACRELATDQPVAIGSTAFHVMIRVGPWSFYLPADVESRFPAVESVIPAPKNEFTCWRISKEDAVFLAKTLPRLPVNNEEHEAVTIDLNGQAMIRSRSSGQSQPTELTLDHSEVTGKPVRFRINRPFLMRALQLGFSQMQVVNADSPALWQDAQRKYVVMLLGKDGAIPPAKDALCISSAGKEPIQRAQETAKPATPRPSQAASRSAEPAPVQRRRVHRNGTPRPKSAESLGDLITEASSLRTALRDVLLRSNQLVRALQRQRKQARLVRSTLASLRQLERASATSPGDHGPRASS